MVDLLLFRRTDWQLLVPVVILLLVSLVTLFSIDKSFFINQLFFAVVGGVFFVAFSQIDVKVFRYFQVPVYIISLVLLIGLLFIGFEARGSVRWLGVGGYGIQFSELLKPFLILLLAGFLSNQKKATFSVFFKVLIFLFPIAFLIFRQPDLGSSMIYVLTTLLVILLYGFPLWWFGLGLFAVVGSIPILWRFLHSYQQQRVLTFLHLTHDPLGTSYNSIQAIIAVGSGMLMGKGLGQGTQSALRFLPEKQTDFIFATLSEDLGFFGAVIVIGASLFLLYRLYKIFILTTDIYEQLIVAGAFSLLLIQMFINIGMNIGIVPIVGVTLPFVSYGGSSLLSNAIILGIVSGIGSFARKKQVLEIG